jgi:hypothetical protein
MPEPSIIMAMFLEPFKAAAADGAVVELKLRLLAGKVPALQKYAHKRHLENIEDDLATHFSLSAEDRETLSLCRQLRNKILHSDFRAARGKLNEMGVATTAGAVTKVDIPVVSVAEVSAKIRGVQAGTEGVAVADTSSADGGVYGWFIEVATAGDFQKASAAFKGAAAIVDRLAAIESVP